MHGILPEENGMGKYSRQREQCEQMFGIEQFKADSNIVSRFVWRDFFKKYKQMDWRGKLRLIDGES